MGLDAYLYYMCPFRPNGDIGDLLQLQQSARMLAVMKQHGVPEVTMKRMGPHGVQEDKVTLAQAEQGAARWGELAETCTRCPVSDMRGTPGCAARVDYPIDGVALGILADALALVATDPDSPGLPFLRSLRASGRDGYGMERVVSGLPQAIVQQGHQRVPVVVDGERLSLSPYMVAEHMCFRSFLDASEALALRGFYRLFYSAVGERILAHPGGETAGQNELFSSSKSLVQLAQLGDLVKRAEQHGLGILMDG